MNDPSQRNALVREINECFNDSPVTAANDLIDVLDALEANAQRDHKTIHALHGLVQEYGKTIDDLGSQVDSRDEVITMLRAQLNVLKMANLKLSQENDGLFDEINGLEDALEVANTIILKFQKFSGTALLFSQPGNDTVN